MKYLLILLIAVMLVGCQERVVGTVVGKYVVMPTIDACDDIMPNCMYSQYVTEPTFAIIVYSQWRNTCIKVDRDFYNKINVGVAVDISAERIRCMT